MDCDFRCETVLNCLCFALNMKRSKTDKCSQKSSILSFFKKSKYVDEGKCNYFTTTLILFLFIQLIDRAKRELSCNSTVRHTICMSHNYGQTPWPIVMVLLHESPLFLDQSM